MQESVAVVLGATGPVGQRVVRLLALAGAAVRVVSRDRQRAAGVCDAVRQFARSARLTPHGVTAEQDLGKVLEGADAVVAAGAAGVQLLPAAVRSATRGLRLAIDLNAVPPVGLEGVDPMDKGRDRDGVICYGAIGIGGTKMKIHKAAVQRLFEANDQILDAEQIYALARQLDGLS
jgi:NAD(P)-dependent dehydrogenase (short-subunit alcohol dehydrogenase family)